ncbi:hypothetical protein GCM10027280_22400 [Micromonospora polyrhachis]|uniref:Uncharacterized protein n=1 Tax=Micromonospora polyrhachis TaxID=1282883 RepID=A0A7W7WS30_9ACTN|nr:hypothetical protein [Micromonospora polyrhachis]MBB4961549.1 hypothetical protein [Micromonospora polyrhachis]
MGDSVGDVVRQFQRVIDALDQTAGVVKYAQAVTEQAYGHYDKAMRGSAHDDVTRAKRATQTAAEKAGKAGRLLSEAATAFAEYVNHIAPGSVAIASATSEGMLGGEQLVRLPGRRGSLSSRLLNKTKDVANSDDGLQHAKKIANAIQDAVRPSGTAAPKTVGPTIKPSSAPQGAHAGDVLLTTLVVAVMGVKGAELAARLRRKVQSNRMKGKRGA